MALGRWRYFVMLNHKKRIGIIGEMIAADYLIEKGYKILDRNIRIGRGEIDIICIVNGKIIFTEVKTRTSHKHGLPEEAITAKKYLKLAELSNDYCVKHGLDPDYFRIDVIAIEVDRKNHLANIRHIKNAFYDVN